MTNIEKLKDHIKKQYFLQSTKISRTKNEC